MPRQWNHFKGRACGVRDELLEFQDCQVLSIVCHFQGVSDIYTCTDTYVCEFGSSSTSSSATAAAEEALCIKRSAYEPSHSWSSAREKSLEPLIFSCSPNLASSITHTTGFLDQYPSKGVHGVQSSLLQIASPPTQPANQPTNQKKKRYPGCNPTRSEIQNLVCVSIKGMDHTLLRSKYIWQLYYSTVCLFCIKANHKFHSTPFLLGGIFVCLQE